MSDARTAEARLERLLHVLPAAMREGGAALDDLAARLETSPDRILEDIEELTARSFYQPGGWPDDVQIMVEAGRVRVHRATGFERPVRLTRDETLCLALALRGAVAAGHLGESGEREALLARAERHLGRPLATDPAANVTAGEEAAEAAAAAPTPTPALGMHEHDIDAEGVRALLLTAAREQTPCAIWYVKPGAGDGSVRVIHPYVVAFGEGSWYVVGHCTAEDGVRVFRLDRVLAGDVAEGGFTVPESFRADEYLQGGRVFHAQPAQDVHEVRVRYAPTIARWIRERARWEPGRLEEAPDGSVVVRHEVTDPHWAVGHALMYGAEAEIVEPAEIRALVRDVVRGLEG